MDPHHERVSFATSQGTVLIVLRVVQTQAILFLKSMSEKDRSAIERILNSNDVNIF